MKSFRFFISFISIFAGLSVMMVSMISASRVYSSEGVNISQMQFYISDHVLPDNLIYPVFMLGDRLRLESATPEEKIFLMIGYADDRLFYAEKLLEKDKKDMALTTLTKSQKYLNSASQLAYELDIYPEYKKRIIKEIKIHTAKVKDLLDEFDTHDKAILNSLFDESLIWQEKLTISLN